MKCISEASELGPQTWPLHHAGDIIAHTVSTEAQRDAQEGAGSGENIHTTQPPCSHSHHRERCGAREDIESQVERHNTTAAQGRCQAAGTAPVRSDRQLATHPPSAPASPQPSQPRSEVCVGCAPAGAFPPGSPACGWVAVLCAGPPRWAGLGQ